MKIKLTKKPEALGKIKPLTSLPLEEIDSIKLWDKNPRKNEGAVKPLMEIIKHHGQISPVVCWDKNRVIYKGNTTWKAMKKLGMKEIRVLWVSFPSETAAAAYAIDDNKGGEFSSWDYGVLSKLMQAEELNVKGFTPQDLKEMSYMKEFIKEGAPSLEGDIVKTYYMSIIFSSAAEQKKFRALVGGRTNYIDYATIKPCLKEEFRV